MKTLSALLLSLFTVANCNAFLINQSSEFGANSVTFDSETYTEWLQPITTISLPGQACCNFQSYYDIVSQMGAGGRYEDWRFASRAQLETFLFSSAGITNLGPDEYGREQYDAAAIAHLFSHTDFTFGTNDPVVHTHLLDAIFQDDDGTMGRTILRYGFDHGSYVNGRIEYLTLGEGQAHYNDAPYGGWLVRVPEPGSLSLFVAGIAGLVWMRRRKK